MLTSTKSYLSRRGLGAWVAAIALLLTLALPTEAQRGGSRRQVWMQLSTGVARVGEKVRLTVVASGRESVRIKQLPEVEGLRFGQLEGPSTSQVTTIINGRRQRVVDSRWSVLVSCEQEGQFEIPGLTVLVGGKPLVTEGVTLKVLRDMSGESLGFFEIKASSDKVVEGMPFTLELNFGWDREAKATYANLSIPWWDNLYGAIEARGGVKPEGNEGVTINDTYTVPIERVQNPDHPGRIAYQLRRSFIATRSGTLEVPTSFLEFGERSRSFFQQRVRNNYFVRAGDLQLEVVPLPSEGRPFEFSGAVGSFKARASVDSRDLIVGDSIKLTVDWTGQGNMEFFEPPALDRLDEFKGFQFYGSTEEKSLNRRRVVFDLAPLNDGVDGIPPVPLWTFDPELSEYVKVETNRIPLRVRGLENAIDLEAGETPEDFVEDIRDLHSAPLGEPGEGPAEDAWQDADRLLLGASAGMLPLWLMLRSLVRRQGDPSGRRAKRRRRALGQLKRALDASSDSSDQLQALVSYLGARSGEDSAAWIGRDLEAYAIEHDLEQHMSDWNAAGDLLSRLDCAVYAGGPPVERAELLAMAERLTGAGL